MPEYDNGNKKKKHKYIAYFQVDKVVIKFIQSRITTEIQYLWACDGKFCES